ncbi:MAG: hypothetical protein AAGI46_15500, partial [Planctomycetota bacterium]
NGERAETHSHPESATGVAALKRRLWSVLAFVGSVALLLVPIVAASVYGSMHTHPYAGRVYLLVWLSMAVVSVLAVASMPRQHARIVLWIVVVGALLMAIASSIWVPGASYLPTLVALSAGMILLLGRWWALPLVLLTTTLMTTAGWLVGLAATLQLAGVPAFVMVITALLWSPWLCRIGRQDRHASTTSA